MDKDVVTLILQNLYSYEEYSRSVLPHLKDEYFYDITEKEIFKTIEEYIEKYNDLPGRDVILIELSNKKDITEETIKYFRETFIDNEKTHDSEWLIDKTEQFCQDMALHNALKQAVSIVQDNDSNLSKTSIPDILKDALSVSFDSAIGHDYINDIDKRFEFYNEIQHKLPFTLEVFNRITNGGLPNKSMMVIMAGTGVGKSLVLTHLSTDFMMSGKNVLYITLEMSEERIEERIDANLLDIKITDLLGVNKDIYYKAVEKKRDSSFGNIITKEYPTAGAHVGHFRYLLKELKTKKNFIPDVLIVDYLNICTSSRIKSGSNQNSYTIVKSIAEELRGLAIEFDIPVITATQTNRTGYRASDVELTDISESFGVAMSSDLILGLMATDELDELNQIGIKVVKNRHGSTGDFYKLNRDFEKMRLSDVNDVPVNTTNSKPHFDNHDTKNLSFEKKYEKIPFDPDRLNKKDKFKNFNI